LVPVWNEIASYSWPAENAPRPVSFDPVSKLFEALNTRQYAPVLDIYATNAVLVTPKQTIQGETNIRTYYEQVIRTQLKRGDFRVTWKSIEDNIIQFRWTCTSQTGNVNDGRDTIGIKNNEIIYHYSYFTIS